MDPSMLSDEELAAAAADGKQWAVSEVKRREASAETEEQQAELRARAGELFGHLVSAGQARPADWPKFWAIYQHEKGRLDRRSAEAKVARAREEARRLKARKQSKRARKTSRR